MRGRGERAFSWAFIALSTGVMLLGYWSLLHLDC